MICRVIHSLRKMLLLILLCATVLFAVVVLSSSLMVTYFTSTRLEWVDDKGKWTGTIHAVMDKDGDESFRFYLSDYNTDRAYTLQVYPAKDHFCENEKVTIRFLGKDGKVFSATQHFVLSELNDDLMIILPKQFAPRLTGDSITLEIPVIRKDGKKEIRIIRLYSQKVRYFNLTA